MVVNAWAESNYDWLGIDKALGFWKSDNNCYSVEVKHCNNWGPIFVATGAAFGLKNFEGQAVEEETIIYTLGDEAC